MGELSDIYPIAFVFVLGISFFTGLFIGGPLWGAVAATVGIGLFAMTAKDIEANNHR